jgi:opacity protein-like surface antigen
MLAVVALATTLAPALARAAVIVIPPRPGQVGLAVQGQYGTLLQSGTIGNDYDAGPGLAVRLRYRMRYERGLGLSFESQRFDAREEAVAETSVTHISVFTYGVDAYQMFGTRTRTTKWLSAGAGLVQTRLKLKDQEIQFTNNNDGVFVAAGAGLERFFWQSWAIDLSTRYAAVFLDGQVNHDLQASLGLVFYASY